MDKNRLRFYFDMFTLELSNGFIKVDLMGGRLY